jgi:RNA polymerase sigma-70 factor (ECF subfamily)
MVPPQLPREGVPRSMDRELASAAAAGDLSALQKLVASVGPRVAAVAQLALGASHPDLDDTIQQALIGFVQALPSFRGECEPARFAASIAVRASIATRRRATRRYADRDDAVDPDSVGVAHGDAAIAGQRKRLVRELLSSLPEEQAESLALRIMLGWTLEQIAVATGAPINTVRSRLRSAKDALRRRIDGSASLREALGVDT